MKVQSQNTGLLKVEDVKTGDTVLIYGEIRENPFSFTNDKGELIEGIDWRGKIKLADGTKKLAIISAYSHDAIIEKFGDETKDWIGLSLEIEINKWGKITFKPSDLPKIANPNSTLNSEDIATINSAKEREKMMDENNPFTSPSEEVGAGKF